LLLICNVIYVNWCNGVLTRWIYRCNYIKCYIHRSIFLYKTVIVVCKQYIDNLISWDWTKEVFTPEDISNKLLLAKDNSERTAWHVASKTSNTELWQQLQELATKNLDTEELSVEWFISKCDTDQAIWQVAAERGNIGMLEKVWEGGKNVNQI